MPDSALDDLSDLSTLKHPPLPLFKQIKFLTQTKQG